MTVDALSIKNSLQNLIEKNNTNTSSYDLSYGLDNRVQMICGGSSGRVPTLNIEYPAVFIELAGVSDSHVELGMSSRRDVDLDFNIIAITDYGMAVDTKGESTDNEVIQLAQNIEELLRNNIRLSSTVDSCLINSTDFVTEEGTYNARSRTSLTAKKRG